MTDLLSELCTHLAALEVDFDVRGDSAVVVLPGVKKLKTICLLTPRSDSLRAEAFVCRAPEENFAEVYRWLLERNRNLLGVSYTLDSLGDIYLVGQVPGPVTLSGLDQILGQVLEAADNDFNSILSKGFETAIRKEWQWRTERGESTRNLAAFGHLSGQKSQTDGTIEGMTHGTLILLRHGQSEWNASNQFTGWVDVALTEKGVEEAKKAGALLRDQNILPDVLYTSLLRRAINTAHLALDAADRLWIPVVRDWRLNERHYGKLQGLNKAEIKEEFGEEQFMLWRRSYDTPPPAIDPDNEYAQTNDPRYANLDKVPATECLLDVVKRFVPYFEEEIMPRAKAGETVLIAAHGNSLRALVKHLEGISDEDIASLNIPTGIPLRYDIDADGNVLNEGGKGVYLDPEAAAAGAAAVAAQGGK